MRVVRFFSLLLGLAFTAAGCAPQPVAYMSYPSPAVAAPSHGIDSVVYGTGGPYVPAPTAAAAYYRAPQYPAPVAAAPAVMVPAPVAAGSADAGGHGGAALRACRASAAASRRAAARGVRLRSGDQPRRIHADSGDRLRIVVFGQEGLTNAYAVDASGFIDMPLIGPVLARGATTDELAGRISAKLRDGFIREPHVAVEIEAYRPFFILGEVTYPGQYPYVTNMTAETAVAIAGGFTPRAFRRNLIVNRTINGHAMRMTVPVTFPLRPGDTVNVTERWF